MRFHIVKEQGREVGFGLGGRDGSPKLGHQEGARFRISSEQGGDGGTEGRQTGQFFALEFSFDGFYLFLQPGEPFSRRAFTV